MKGIVNGNILFKKIQIIKFHVYIWNQQRICIKMSTNKPMFGPVVLEISCRVHMNQTFSPHESL